MVDVPRTLEYMAQITVPVAGYRCERCGHEWIARQPRNLPPPKKPKKAATRSPHKFPSKPAWTPPKPKLCPFCKSAWWETPPSRA